MNDYLRKRQEHILSGRPLPEKKKYYLPKVSEKRKTQLTEQKNSGSENAQDRWFEERRKELTGKCLFCHGKTTKDDDKFYRAAIAHLLPKKKNKFPSVACHPNNYLELCLWGNACHQNFDNGTITWEFLRDSKEWDIIIGKFKKIYPFIKEEEKKNIPELLLKEIQCA